MKYNRYLFETLRCSPIIFDYIFLTLYSTTNESKYLKFILIKVIIIILNKFIKEFFRYIFKTYGIFKNNGYYLPILGRGDRPYGAKNCGIFNDCSNKLSTSHGFPSGHAQSAGSILVLMNLIIKNPTHKLYVFIFTLLISWARLYEKCHTPQQVISGYLIGVYLTKILLSVFK